VTEGRSVEYHIKKSNKMGREINVINLAVDNSCINDIYEQLRYIPEDSRDGVIFLSVGGNDILKKYVYVYNTNFTGLPNLFKKYKELVERIKTQFPQHKLVLMNIYYPPNKQIFSPFYPLIKEWNKLISSTMIDNEIIHIDEIMTEKEDFVDNIEPSEKGGEKIANSITTHISYMDHP
jgi:lysophospholipase L1-like esterase